MNGNKKSTISVIIGLSFMLMLLLMLAVVFIGQARETLYDEKVNYLEEISLKSSTNIKEQITGYLVMLEAMATFVGNQEIVDFESTLPILSKEADKNLFKRMGIILPDGTAMTTDGLRSDFSNRVYFKQALEGRTTVSDCLIDQFDGTEINVFSTPIYQKGKIVGVIFATQTHESFSKAMTIESFSGEGYSYIITSAGLPVVRTLSKNSIGDYQNLFEAMRLHGVGEDDLNKLMGDIKNGQNGSVSYIRDGVMRQFCYAKIGVNDWYILSAVPAHAISRQSDKLIIKLSIITGLIILMVAIISLMMIRILQKNNSQLKKIAYTDRITGYGNWAKFCLDATAIMDNHPEQKFAMIVFDINKFKVINDVFGYETGNSVLKMLAEILEQNSGAMETFTRASSDNFNMLMCYERQEDIVKRLDKLIGLVENSLEGYKIALAIGIYPITEKNLEINVLSDRATISKNIAKKQNDHCYHFFQEKNRIEIINEKEIENVMASALENGEFEVYLQPKYSLITEKIVGAEALVRWNRRGVGLMMPNDFIPLFEKNGFIRKLDLYMFEQVCALQAKWQKDDARFLRVPISVNISRVHLSNRNLPQKLLDIISRYQVCAQCLEIELTESAVFLDVENMIQMMFAIKEVGFLLAIDDFGSGYSSLSALKDLPADYVKIDKSFLDKAINDQRGTQIIRSIIAMTKGLGLTAVAEGVETRDQVRMLQDAGCDIAQGYFYAKAMPIVEFERLIKKQA